MTIIQDSNTQCDHCGKKTPTVRATGERSRWVRIAPLSRRPGLIIGQPTIIGKEFCSEQCLTSLCAKLFDPKLEAPVLDFVRPMAESYIEACRYGGPPGAAGSAEEVFQREILKHVTPLFCRTLAAFLGLIPSMEPAEVSRDADSNRNEGAGNENA